MQTEYVDIYCDGSFRPVNGKSCGGYGVYIKRDENDSVSIAGPVTGRATNNTAELQAFIRSLKYAITESIDVRIFSDSKYVLDGLKTYMKTWVKNDFIKADGTAVLNKELWLEINTLIKTLKSKGIKISLRWVKGHSSDVGNSKADTLARKGAALFAANEPEIIQYVNEETIKKNSKRKPPVKHPLMSFKRLFFVTNSKVTKINDRYCYMGTTYDDDDKTKPVGNYLHKNAGNTSINLLLTDKPIDDFENIIEKQNSITDESYNYNVLLRLENYYKKDHYYDIVDNDYLSLSDESGSLFLWGNVQITHLMRPALLSIYSIPTFEMLGKMIYAYEHDNLTKNGDIIFDIKDTLRSTDKNNKPCICPDLNGGNGLLEFNLPINSVVEKCPLTVGVDIPNKNILRKICKDEEFEAKLVVFGITPTTYRVLSIITSKDGTLVTYAPNSSLRICSSVKMKKSDKQKHIDDCNQTLAKQHVDSLKETT